MTEEFAEKDFMEFDHVKDVHIERGFSYWRDVTYIVLTLDTDQELALIKEKCGNGVSNVISEFSDSEINKAIELIIKKAEHTYHETFNEDGTTCEKTLVKDCKRFDMNDMLSVESAYTDEEIERNLLNF